MVCRFVNPQAYLSYKVWKGNRRKPMRPTHSAFGRCVRANRSFGVCTCSPVKHLALPRAHRTTLDHKQRRATVANNGRQGGVESAGHTIVPERVMLSTTATCSTYKPPQTGVRPIPRLIAGLESNDSEEPRLENGEMVGCRRWGARDTDQLVHRQRDAPHR